MIPEVEVVVQLAVIAVATVGSLTGIYIATSLLLRRARRVAPAPEIAQQLEHMQQSIDTIAIEVERIAEAQRFSAKLLAERSDQSSIAP